ncbi:MAG: transcription elongation factor GreA [Candidatus Limnocylindrales bacterium]
MSGGPLGAPDLLRSVGLIVDGPAAWGTRVRSSGPGVYVIELPSAPESAPVDFDAIGRWLDRVPGLTIDGAVPTGRELAARLHRFWLPGQPVLYIGMSAVSIGARLDAFARTPLGDRKPHAGGYWLKALSGLERLRVWWSETDAAEEYQDALLDAFSAGVPTEVATELEATVVLPFANLQAPDGRRKEHGIKGALAQEAPAGPVTPAQRLAAAVKPARRPSRGILRSDGVIGDPVRRAPVRRDVATPVSGPDAPRPPTRVTATGLAAMQAEHHQLTTVARPAIVARIKAARELGDLRENSEYQEARREQSFAEGRIQALDELLRNVDVIEEGAAIHRVELGTSVVVDDGSGESAFRIVGPSESDPRNGRISARSPIGAAMLGHLPGDEVEVVSPAGTTRYRIVSIG